MAKIGILTFHASHNFGSMLQAFALQHTLQKMGHLVQIINFRSEVQRAQCSGPYHKPVEGVRGFVRKLILSPFKKDLTGKYNKFESFIKMELNCTPVYATVQEVLANCASFDFYICGSDQIWNSTARDFSWLYFLPFRTGNKIAYAPSAGDKVLLPQDKEKIVDLLSYFSAISVREQKLADVLGTLLPTKPQVALDPTLLLTAEKWASHIDKKPLVKGDYLFVYAPYRMPALLKTIPTDNKMPLVIASPFDVVALYSRQYVKRLNTGPWEFLNLIYHSKGVVSGSFHAAVFAKLFKKPLYCIDMGPGSRIANLEEKFKHLEQERASSLQFLREALNE